MPNNRYDSALQLVGRIGSMFFLDLGRYGRIVVFLIGERGLPSLCNARQLSWTLTVEMLVRVANSQDFFSLDLLGSATADK